MELRKREEGPESLGLSNAKEIEMAREFFQGLQLWRDLKPRRVQALCACEGRAATRDFELELSYEAGAVMDGARPAAWLDQDSWLEATLDGREGLVWMAEVEYLPEHSADVNMKAVSGLTDNPGLT